MASKGYTTRQAIENYLLITIDASFYTQVDNWISEIETYIDQLTGRNFVADATASRRRFSGYGKSTLITDDFIVPQEAAWADAHAYSLNELVTMEGRNYKCIHAHTSSEALNEPGHGSAWETEWEINADVKVEIVEGDPLEQDNIILTPENAPQRGVPYTGIKIIAGAFYHGTQNVSVKARWGYSEAAPADIRTAATVLVAGIINYSLNAEGEVKTLSIGRYSVTYKDDAGWEDFKRVPKILETYRKFTF